jgi:tRNA A-37 threonylcarbamoyl transferase component Bud32
VAVVVAPKYAIEHISTDSALDSINDSAFEKLFCDAWSCAVVIKENGKIESRSVSINKKIYFAKQYTFANGCALWLYTKKWHKFNRMLSAAKVMEQKSVAVPTLFRVIVDLQQRRLFSLSEFSAQGKDLRCLIGDDLDSDFAKNNLTIKIAKMMACLHGKANVVHGDFKWANILYDSLTSEVMLVDIDGARVAKPGSKLFFRDVARFIVDCEEAGLSKQLIKQTLECYSEFMRLPLNRVMQEVEKFHMRFKKRHEKRYGKSFRLLNPDR